ncbi:MAG: hypothetical protein HY855_18725 [Burkholderiales bacterium]|nr:hypothetical protein [Burkholderiales bacterium]
MFVVPAIALPFVLGLALFRLYQIPRQLWSGDLRFAAKGGAGLRVAVVLAWLVLLGTTLLLVGSVIQSIVTADHEAANHVFVLACVAGYPIVYIGTAWVFYHGLEKRPAAKHGEASSR